MLWLSREQALTLADLAESAVPNEVCGLIGGRNGKAECIIPVQNVSHHPDVSYSLDPQQQVEAMLSLQRDKLDLLAIYHSHPRHEAIPSPTDVRYATYPDTLYLVIGLKRGIQLKVWQIRHGEVSPARLHIGNTSPTPDADFNLTNSGKIAILIAIVLATVAVIAYAVYLLPPAPPIPGG